MTREALGDTKRRLRMTWAQLAKETGYSESHLYNCLSGQRKITKQLQVVLEMLKEKRERIKKISPCIDILLNE